MGSWAQIRRAAVGSLLAVLMLVGGCSTRHPDSASAPAAPCGGRDQGYEPDVAYLPDGGHDGLTELDVYPFAAQAGCPPTPVLVWVHGGGWQIGDKANQLADKMRLAAGQGWMLVSVNYRLVPGVRYPVPNQDIAAAVAWVLDYATQYGADPGRLALMGHSAGGGIVAAITTDERYLDAVGRRLSDVECAASLDTEGYDVAAGVGQSDLYEAYFGADAAQWPDQSPITHVAPGKAIPDYFIVTRGTPARIGTAQRFADTLRDAGVPTTLILATGLTHAGVNDAVGDPGDDLITPALADFLTGCFR